MRTQTRTPRASRVENGKTDSTKLTRAQATEIAYHRKFYHRMNWLYGTTYRDVPMSANPLDSWVLQEIIWETRPQVIVETGTWSGGSALFMVEILEKAWGTSIPYEVITIDTQGLKTYYSKVPAVMSKLVRVEHPRISFVTGDSTDPKCVKAVKDRIKQEGYQRCMVVLDSDHHAAHVRKELDAYGGLVSPGCYLIVQDTNVEFLNLKGWVGVPGPIHAVMPWLQQHQEFAVDRTREKFGLTFHPGGWLKRVQ